MKPMKDIAYDQLKELIINGTFAPGSIVLENSLLECTGMGRTPVRQALNRLEQENLVCILPKKGIQITKISMFDIANIYELRKLIEPLAARLAARNIDPAKLIPFRQAFLQRTSLDNFQEYAVIDRAFHDQVNAASENSLLHKRLMNVFDLNARIRTLSKKKVLNRYEQARREHLNLIDALMKGDAKQAEAIMRIHVANGEKAALTLLEDDEPEFLKTYE